MPGVPMLINAIFLPLSSVCEIGIDWGPTNTGDYGESISVCLLTANITEKYFELENYNSESIGVMFQPV